MDDILMREDKIKEELKENIGELFIPQGESEKTVVEKDFMDVLKMVAPGTSIRIAMDDLLNAGMGALIVVDNGNISSAYQKGFGIHSKFSTQKLVELAKMDGAIILSRNVKKILYANSFLSPNPEINTRETGTRHKSAERTAKQTGAIVIAISERKRKITIYQGDKRYELKESSEILRRATENLQILDKQRESFNEAINNLNLMELQRIVTVKDVCGVIQRFEIIKRISEIVKRYLIELGREGVIVSMSLKDLTNGLEKEEELLLKDYFGTNSSYAEKVLEKMDFDFLLEPFNISRMLFEELHDKQISPKGLRILSKTNILERYISSLISNFQFLDKILLANDEELLEVFQNEGMLAFFKEEIYGLREKLTMGKSI
jgi:diadenylate cyclase